MHEEFIVIELRTRHTFKFNVNEILLPVFFLINVFELDIILFLISLFQAHKPQSNNTACPYFNTIVFISTFILKRFYEFIALTYYLKNLK